MAHAIVHVMHAIVHVMHSTVHVIIHVIVHVILRNNINIKLIISEKNKHTIIRINI